MRVMHVVHNLPVGGMERMVVEMANATRRPGYEVSVCTIGCDATLAPELEPHVGIHVVGRRWRYDLRGAMRFSRLVRDAEVDVLQAHNRGMLVFLGFVKAVAPLEVPIIYHEHSSGFDLREPVPAWFRVLGRRWIEHFVGVYDGSAAWAERAGIPRSRIRVIGNGIDLRRFEEIRPVDLRRELAAPRETPIGVMVSTVRRAKGIELLLDAAARSGFRTRMRIAVIGREADARYARECLERRTRLGLDGCVVFLGERSDVAGLLHGADFGLLSSRRESGPLVLAEYLACGLPFISTRVGGLGHRVAELGVPDFVPPDRPEAFARAIDRLLELPEAERRTRGERGREIAREHLDIRRLMPAWYDLYQSAASSAARPGS